MSSVEFVGLYFAWRGSAWRSTFCSTKTHGRKFAFFHREPPVKLDITVFGFCSKHMERTVVVNVEKTIRSSTNWVQGILGVRMVFFKLVIVTDPMLYSYTYISCYMLCTQNNCVSYLSCCSTHFLQIYFMGFLALKCVQTVVLTWDVHCALTRCL